MRREPPKPRWVPVAVATAASSAWAPEKTFPAADLRHELFNEMETSLFPMPPFPRPAGSTRHSRGRQRFRKRCEVWREATNFISMLNILDKGRVGTMTEYSQV